MAATELRTYARMADNVYQTPNAARMMAGLAGWEVYGMGVGEGGSVGGVTHNSGFKGCIYKSPREIVVCYKGTGGGALIRDVLADAKLLMGVVPREASAANNLFNNALRVFGDVLPITIVGHSLGGALTQVVAHWYKVRFVTFNAPPMLSSIQKAKINILKPQQMVRAIRASAAPANLGFNYRLAGDPVSLRVTSVLGHYGDVITIDGHSFGVSGAHSMTNFVDFLERSSDGRQTPFG